ncbi:hypothetical protein HDU98_000865 [Podochytrium sp. JEL0797]|nr:hypothetical protein HDU98_000865 [Podochytrium sp. JEL0797]
MNQRRFCCILLPLLLLFTYLLTYGGPMGGVERSVHLASTFQKPNTKAPNVIPPPTENHKIVDLMQVQFLDFLNGETEEMWPDTFGGSITDAFDYKKAWIHILAYSKRIAHVQYDIRHFHELAMRARSLFIAYRILYESSPTLQEELAAVSPEKTTKALMGALTEVVENLTRVLFPWINPPFSSILNMQLTFLQGPSTGIVLTCGTRQFYMCQHAILALRDVWNNHLPVEVFYAGDGDLHPLMVESLNSMKGVKAKNILTYFVNETREWDTWSLKPYAILASSFRTVLFMDADVLFLKDPREVLKSKLFKRNGHLFYRDRKYREDNYVKGTVWFNGVNPHMSKYGRGLSYTNLDPEVYSTTHQMESGFIAVDKGRVGPMFALLMACKMNGVRERGHVLYQFTYGDKESFWFSSEMMRVPYAFNPSYGGVLGHRKPDRSTDGPGGWSVVCGIWLLHVDEKMEPFWWNGGGVLKDRGATKDFEFVEFGHYASHTFDHDLNERQWVGPGHCLNQTNAEVNALSAEQKGLMGKYNDIFRSKVKEIVLPVPPSVSSEQV